MRGFLGLFLALLIGLFLGWFFWRGGGGGGRGGTTYVCSPKEVNVVVDSVYKYHLPANQKTVHLSLSAHDFVTWTFDADSTVDSVTAVFGGSSPFASHRFEFADSAAFSGAPRVASGPTIYDYTITVYPHGGSPVTADPGVVIDM